MDCCVIQMDLHPRLVLWLGSLKHGVEQFLLSEFDFQWFMMTHRNSDAVTTHYTFEWLKECHEWNNRLIDRSIDRSNHLIDRSINQSIDQKFLQRVRVSSEKKISERSKSGVCDRSLPTDSIECELLKQQSRVTLFLLVCLIAIDWDEEPQA